VANSDVFVWLMLAALLAGAIWLNIATASRAPVSTTHSIVGGVLGAGSDRWLGCRQLGPWLDRRQLDHFAAMGVVSRRPLFHQAPDSLPPGCHGRGAPRRSLLVAGMAWAFTTYLMLKGVRAVLKVGFVESALAGGVVALLTYVVVRRASPGSRTPARRTTRRASM
jgi:PiT family inorganic phosphate transporter